MDYWTWVRERVMEARKENEFWEIVYRILPDE